VYHWYQHFSICARVHRFGTKNADVRWLCKGKSRGSL